MSGIRPFRLYDERPPFFVLIRPTCLLSIELNRLFLRVYRVKYPPIYFRIASDVVVCLFKPTQAKGSHSAPNLASVISRDLCVIAIQHGCAQVFLPDVYSGIRLPPLCDRISSDIGRSYTGGSTVLISKVHKHAIDPSMLL